MDAILKSKGTVDLPPEEHLQQHLTALSELFKAAHKTLDENTPAIEYSIADLKKMEEELQLRLMQRKEALQRLQSLVERPY
jgi:hypothetical protein